MTENANPTLGTIEKFFKFLVWDSLVTAAMTQLGINFWPINVILRYFTDQLFAATKLVVDLQAIAFINDQHKAEFDRAALKLKIFANNYGIESEEFKRARDEAKKSLSKFIRFNGS